MGTGQDGLTFLVKHRIGAEEEAIAADDGLFVRVPDDQLFIGLLHLVVLIEVNLVARRAAGFPESDFAQPADLRDDIRRILPGNDVEFVVSLIGVFQFLGWGKLGFEQRDGDGIDNCFHRMGNVSQYRRARGWIRCLPCRAWSCGQDHAYGPPHPFGAR